MSREFPCVGSVSIYGYSVYFRDGRYYILDKDLNELKFTYNINNAISKLTAFIINDLDDYSTVTYEKVRKEVSEKLGEFEDE